MRTLELRAKRQRLRQVLDVLLDKCAEVFQRKRNHMG